MTDTTPTPQGRPLDPDLGIDEGVRGTRKHVRVAPGHLGLVLLGGTLGTAVREALTLSIPHLGNVPAATMLINVTGAFLLGVLLETLVRRGDDTGTRRSMRLFFGTGALGGFTTYSALALDTHHLIAEGLLGTAATYALGTVVVGVVAAWAGILVGAGLHARRKGTRS